MPTFTVDTQLFRELGELLVGRASTALVELIKNAYDADATLVIVSATDLSNPGRGRITIVDDGVGMTDEQFAKGFLRIAGRGKGEGSRRSTVYARHFTGAKGIGRLAAHKLAHELEVTSTARSSSPGIAQSQVQARIRWDEIERQETLGEVIEGIDVSSVAVPSNSPPGTTVRLNRLRRAWSDIERERFHNEITTFQAPPSLASAVPRTVLPEPLLFDIPTVRDRNAKDPGFEVLLEGDLESGDDPWAEYAEAASWVLEIVATRDGVEYAVAPTLTVLEENPTAERVRVRTRHPDPAGGPFFQARVYIREGQAPAALRSKIKQAAGVRVYMEGFRVLPYGERGNDWLGVARSYGERVTGLSFPSGIDFGEQADREGLSRPTNEQLHGAVFLTEQNASTLRMLVNREGFVPEAGFEHLTAILEQGINLSTRARAAASQARRQDRRESREEPSGGGASRADDDYVPPQTQLETSLRRAAEAVDEAAEVASGGDLDKTRSVLIAAASQLANTAQATEELISEQGLLRVLASVGTQMASFVHELNRIVSNVVALEQLVMQSGDPSLIRLVGDVRRSLERQASYLIDVVGPDTRRRRSRQKIGERVSVAWRFVADSAAVRGITLDTEVPEDLKMPPLFPAESSAVFSNLLTNAVKNAGDGGCVRVSAVEGDGLRVRIENTGTKVALDDAERWFRPFVSTTTEVDPVLGQGLGLGLPITREILAPYGARVRFVVPSPGFATALEIVFP